MRAAPLLLAAALALAACGGNDDPARPTTTAAPSSSTTASSEDRGDLASVELRLREVARLDAPLAMTWCASRDEPLVAEKTGRVRTLGGDLVLDLSGEVSDANEQGLLGIACTPDGGELVASYTDRAGDSRVVAYPLPPAGQQVDADAGRTLLEQKQPAANHNGGNVLFGPDGALWLGLGDGGGADDRFGNAQDPDSRLGALLRLDLTGASEPEIVLKGLRNPWRFSFDRATGDLWIGDVGQDDREEIDRLAAGAIDGRNLGWPAFEGTRRHREDVDAPADAVAPVFEYGRDDGQSVAGGYVYRGDDVPGLRGAYLFADTYTARIRAIVVEGDEVVAERDLGPVPGGLVASFAEDPDGELYVLSLEGGVFRLEAR